MAQFEQVFKNLDNILWKEAGCGSELDYTEQSSWLLFLKYLNDLEEARKDDAELAGEDYAPIIGDAEYRWSSWAAPHDNAMTGDDLITFVNDRLFPALKAIKTEDTKPDTIQYKIGEIFSEIKNKFTSGYSLRDALDEVHQLQFNSYEHKHEMSALYEEKIKNMGNAGRNGGEYYTPRPLVRAMIEVMNPQIGETIYDPSCGSAGFLCEAYGYLRPKVSSSNDLDVLQKETLYGKEKKNLAYIIGTMNMILHGIEAPNIVHANTLAQNIREIREDDRYDVILANPPFGGKERAEVQQNFPVKTGETAFLFLQHFIKSLKAGGRAAVVIKNTFLSNGDNAAIALRKQLLEDCDLHTILDCPAKTFLGAGVKTVVLFFTKGKPTQNIWYYGLDVGRSLGKTDPLNDNDLTDFVTLQKTFGTSEKSWSVAKTDLDEATYDLSPKNPNKNDEIILRSPEDILLSLRQNDNDIAGLMNDIEAVL